MSMTLDEMKARQEFYWKIRKDFAAKHGRQPKIWEVEREAKAIEDQRKAAIPAPVKVVVKAAPPSPVAKVKPMVSRDELKRLGREKERAAVKYNEASDEGRDAALAEYIRASDVLDRARG